MIGLSTCGLRDAQYQTVWYCAVCWYIVAVVHPPFPVSYLNMIVQILSIFSLCFWLRSIVSGSNPAETGGGAGRGSWFAVL